MPKKNDLGLRLRNARVRAGLTQKDLDGLLGFGANSVRMYENGYRDASKASPERISRMEQFVSEANSQPLGAPYNDGQPSNPDPCYVCESITRCRRRVQSGWPALCEKE
jgi:transcriptional regulator with XRE-family HTH domain